MGGGLGALYMCVVHVTKNEVRLFPEYRYKLDLADTEYLTYIVNGIETYWFSRNKVCSNE